MRPIVFLLAFLAFGFSGDEPLLLQKPAVSKTHIVFVFAGDLWSVPRSGGDAVRLTSGTGNETNPAFSPDGTQIAFTGEYDGNVDVFVMPALGGVPKRLTWHPSADSVMGWTPDGKRILFSSPRFSPDSKKLALVDSFQRLWYVDLETKAQVEVAQDYYQMRAGNIAGAWSPDSKWLAYSKVLPNNMSAIHLYSLADGKSTRITDGMSDAANPVFDKDGKYLYFTASTNSGEALALDIHRINASPTSSIYLVVLDKTLASPFAPESDEEKIANDGEKPESGKTGAADNKEKPEAGADDRKKQAANETGAEEDEEASDADKTDSAEAEQSTEMPKPRSKPKQDMAEKSESVKDIKVDLDNIDQRILAVPMPPQAYADLQVAKPGTLLALAAPAAAGEETEGIPDGMRGMNVHRYDLKKRKSDIALSGVTFFEMSFSGEKALYRQGESWRIAALRPAAPGAGGLASAPPPGSAVGQEALKTAGIEVRVDPVQEWKQMYREAWRIERDFFYDRRIHGFDLKAAEKQYEPYLSGIASRRDLTYLFQEMLGNMVVGHLGTGGGDMPQARRVPTGLLGADYEIANERYRFSRVYRGENWNPQLRAPLTQPGVDVQAGEYLLEVNGREVRPPDNVYSFFEGLAGKSVVLKVGTDPEGDGAREVKVVPMADESQLRNLAWREENRGKVDELTDGRVAYVYMPDTSAAGLNAFNRYFYAQIDKHSVIIDERFNGGGMLATDIAEILNRKPLSAAANRTGADPVQPRGIFGPKVMIINELAGSGGDAMPWYFKRSGAGKLIGTRTWGGLVGMASAPPLMDGGIVTAPASGIYNPLSGQWEVENIGVAPDIEVEQDPALVRKGHDPQLERAVGVVLEELKRNPPPKLRRPEFPNYHHD